MKKTIKKIIAFFSGREYMEESEVESVKNILNIAKNTNGKGLIVSEKIAKEFRFNGITEKDGFIVSKFIPALKKEL